MGVKFSEVENVAGQYQFNCPGCECSHFVDTHETAPVRWTFNGDLEKPTLWPSVRVRASAPLSDDEHTRIMRGEDFMPTETVCHFFIKDGFYEYCADSTHKYSGQKIEVPDWESF